MSKVTCNIDEIQDFKNKIDSINTDLLFELKKIEKEINNIEEVINTPKSKELKELFYYYTIDKIQMVDDNKEIFNNNLEIVIKEYTEFLIDVQKMVNDYEKNPRD